MNFSEDLYIGEQVRNLRRIKSKLKKGAFLTNVYVITFASGNDLLEIYDAKVFVQPYYKKFSKPIVGIAADYEEALALVIRILREAYESRGDYNVKAYLTRKGLEKGQE